MINNDSIVTAYDEHLTLVEWLQKVEKALNESVLTNLGIAKLSDQGNIATYRVTATFADNTTIVSDTFTLPSTNIVTAFNDLTALVNGFDDRITDNTNDVASILNIIDIANDKINASTLQNSINGSDDVIVDVDATNDKLEIHLSAELQAKLARVLLKPSSAPTTRKVVTIDTNGAQDNVDGTELTTLMGNIVDSNGHNRFAEGNLSLGTPFANLGVTMTYGKWQLSGGHLMLVVALKIPSGVTTPTNSLIARAILPTWLSNKLVGLWTNTLDVKDFSVRNSVNWYQNITAIRNVTIFKADANTLFISSSDALTTEVESTCRIQFDFIIDTD